MLDSFWRIVGLLIFVYCICEFHTARATQYNTPGIRGSAHDFAYNFGCFDSVTGTLRSGCVPWQNSFGKVEDEICIFCHTPHHANDAITDAPLWNRSANQTTYTVYQSPTASLDATIDQPNGISRLCLSCHDGTIAVDAYGTNGAGAAHTLKDLSGGLEGHWGAPIGTSPPNLGTSLLNDHPISFVYDSNLALVDGGLWDPVVKISEIGDKPVNIDTPTNLPTLSIPGSGSKFTIARDMLDRNMQVQCTSCHDAHNKYGWDKFLLKNNTGSALCLTCHNK